MLDRGFDGSVVWARQAAFGGDDALVLPAFLQGTMILTDRGERAVETLHPGDRVLTRDNGYRAILWLFRRAGPSAPRPSALPVVVAPGALGEGSPARETVLSPDQRLLLTGEFGAALGVAAESLARAADLVGMAGITRAASARADYVHLALATHEIVCANGAWTESLPVSPSILAALPQAARADLAARLTGGMSAPARPNADRLRVRRIAAA